jgi:hypothetical protein
VAVIPNASMSGMPPLVWGTGNLMDSCAVEEDATAIAARTMATIKPMNFSFDRIGRFSQ